MIRNNDFYYIEKVRNKESEIQNKKVIHMKMCFDSVDYFCSK